MKPTVPYSSPNLPGIFNPKIIGVLSIILIISGGVFYYFYSQKNSPLKSQIDKLSGKNSTSAITLSDEQNKAIAKVGQEIIYQSDLDKELSFQPTSNDPNLKTRMLAKIATDSAILQGAREIALITLDDSVFNSRSKDYIKRVKLVNEAISKVQQNANSTTGAVVSIWFLTEPQSELDYENAKKLAFEKISALYADVKSGKITIKQAGDAIKNDATLAKVDPSYQTNAILNFIATKNLKITRDDLFNQAILKLKEGEITDLFTGTSINSQGKKVDSHYLFGQINNKITNSKIINFNTWLTAQRRANKLEIY